MEEKKEPCDVSLKENLAETISIIEKKVEIFNEKSNLVYEEAKVKAEKAVDAAMALKDRIAFANKILTDDALYESVKPKTEA